MLGMGVQVEEFAHYIRAQKNGGVRYGFGKVVGVTDDELLNPKYDEDWEKKAAGIASTELGRAVLDSDGVLKLAGVRPLSVFGNHPLIKEYKKKWSGLILNTGYGWHGFVLSWKSAQL